MTRLACLCLGVRAEGVSVSFKSRTNVVRAHLLVAADGMASTIRQHAVTTHHDAANKPISSGHVSQSASQCSGRECGRGSSFLPGHACP